MISTLTKILCFSFVLSLFITGIRTYPTDRVSEQRDDFLVNLMMSYLPGTPEQLDCVKKVYDSSVFVKPNTKEKIINQCQLEPIIDGLDDDG